MSFDPLTAAAAPTDPALTPLVTAMHDGARVRVWSLIVTILGDGAEHLGGWMASARLAELLGALDVLPGAMRAALSRLTRDGWVERARSGRTTAYRLSPARRAEAAAAGRLIYRAPRTLPVTDWVLATGLSDLQPDWLSTAPGTALWPADEAPPMTAGELRVYGKVDIGTDGLQLPGGMTAARRRMRADLEMLSPGHAQSLSPLIAMAARTALLHRWRRLVLRYPDLPPPLDPRGDLRAQMATRYLALLPASETWLADGAPQSRGSSPSRVAWQRFSESR